MVTKGILSGITCKVGFDKLNLDIDFPINHHINLNKNELESFAKDSLSKISPVKQFSINELNILYSEVEATPYSKYNTIIEVNIPYVLHIPNNTEINLVEPGKVKVFISKIWTYKSLNSYVFDALADDRILYYKDGSLTSPKIPQEQSLGWKWEIPEVKNVEEIHQTGALRYTKLKIHFDCNFSIEKLKSEEFNSKILPKLYNYTLEIVNKIISTYRHNFKDYYLNILNHIEIMSIYFPRYGFGYYPLGINIGDAIINREKGKINDFIKNLKLNEGIQIYDILLDNAKSSLINRDFKSAIIESFTSTDIFVESFIISGLKKIGKGSKDMLENDKKEIYWSTKLGLNLGCKFLFGDKFLVDNKAIYDDYYKFYKIRNKVIHKGYSPNYNDSISSIGANERIINLLKNKRVNKKGLKVQPFFKQEFTSKRKGLY